MALINKQYVFVLSEEVQRGVNVSEHPVESGLKITDNVRREPVVIKIKGEIVGKKAASKLSKITKLHQKGKYVKYIGRNVMNNAIITSLNTSHPNTVYGGCEFDMELKEIRIAKSPVQKKKGKKTKGGTKQVTKKSKKNTRAKTYTVKSGDTLWSIANKYYGKGASCTKIKTANKLKSNAVRVGQKLKIPA